MFNGLKDKKKKGFVIKCDENILFSARRRILNPYRRNVVCYSIAHGYILRAIYVLYFHDTTVRLLLILMQSDQNDNRCLLISFTVSREPAAR